MRQDMLSRLTLCDAKIIGNKRLFYVPFAFDDLVNP